MTENHFVPGVAVKWRGDSWRVLEVLEAGQVIVARWNLVCAVHLISLSECELDLSDRVTALVLWCSESESKCPT